MSTENDTQPMGGEGISIDDAVKRFTTSNPPAVDDQAETEEPDEVDQPDDETDASEEADDTAEGDTGDEDQAEADDQEPETDKGRFVADNAKVRLEDGTVVLIADLKKGSLLHADYTRKTQEVAEQRRTVESQSERIKATETQIEQQRQQMVKLLQAIVPADPDPAQLAADPMGYFTQKAERDRWVQHLQSLEAEQQRAVEARQAETAEQRKTLANKEWEALLTKVPEFKDEKRVNRFISDLKEFGAANGFSPEELQAVAYDHRQAIVLRKAIAYDKLQAQKPKAQAKVEGRPPVQRGGKRLSPDDQRARAATVAVDRLKQSGSVDDAARAYLARQKG